MNQVIDTRLLKSNSGYRFKTGLFGKQILQVSDIYQSWDTNTGYDDEPNFVIWRNASKKEAEGYYLFHFEDNSDMEQCEATKRNYNHKAERAKQTPEQIQNTKRVVFDQTMEANKTRVVDCAGELKNTETGETERCPKRLMLIWMYRCWFCNRWLCPACAKAHFGDRS